VLTAFLVVAALGPPAVVATTPDRSTAGAPNENRTGNATVSRARGALFDDPRAVVSLGFGPLAAVLAVGYVIATVALVVRRRRARCFTVVVVVSVMCYRATDSKFEIRLRDS
jgi:hypothetical protein